MVPTPGSRLAWLAILVLAAGACMRGARAEDGAAPSGGPVYTNDQAGLTVRGPAGWRMKADAKRPSEWTRLVTFYDGNTDADAVLSVRPRESATIDALYARIKREWETTKGVAVSSMRKLARSPTQPVATVIVDASYVEKPKPRPGANPGLPPPPVPYRVSATYFLAPDGEYLLYAKAQQTHWSRLLPKLRSLRASVQFANKDEGPKGQGVYRNERAGLVCRFPEDYAVVVSQFRNEIVRFEGVSANDPALGIFEIDWNESAEKDAERLMNWYVEEHGGEAALSAMTVAGREATLVTARADLGGRDQVVLQLVFERSRGKLWRIRVSMPPEREDDGRALLRRFLDEMRLTTPKR